MKMIFVAGFLSSGSSAVVDLLREFDNIHVCEEEFRCISDPYGIRQLENSLVEHWTPLRATAAISDFLEYAKKCSRKKTYFPLAPFGMGYGESINSDFMEITEEYIESLIFGTYYSDYYYNKARKSYISYCIDRCRFGLFFYSKGKIPIEHKIKCFLSHPSKSEFEERTRIYFDTLFKHMNDKEYVLLDQGIHPPDAADVLERYFTDAKMIIVDRDWRDMFVDRMEWGYRMDDSEESIKNQIRQERILRESIGSSNKIMHVKFEDLVENYDFIVHNIATFLGIDGSHHITPLKYFNPRVSAKNVGMWKRLYHKYIKYIDIISRYML